MQNLSHALQGVERLASEGKQDLVDIVDLISEIWAVPAHVLHAAWDKAQDERYEARVTAHVARCAAKRTSAFARLRKVFA